MTASTSSPAGRSTLAVALAFAAIYLIWGSTYLAIRFAIETVPPFLMAGSRFIVAGLLLYGWARLSGAARPTSLHWRNATIVGTLLMFGGNGLVTLAEKSIPSGAAAVLVGMMPLWMACIDAAFFGGPRIGLRAAGGLLLGIAGVVVLVLPAGDDLGRIAPAGALMVVCASLCWATGSLTSRRLDLGPSLSASVGMEMLTGGAVMMAAGLVLGEARGFDPAAVSAGSALSWAYLISFGSIVALSAYLWLLRVVRPAAAATYAFVNPVVAVVLGYFLGGEALTSRTLLGTLLVVAAVALLLLPAPAAAARRSVAARRVGGEAVGTS